MNSGRRVAAGNQLIQRPPHSAALVVLRNVTPSGVAEELGELPVLAMMRAVRVADHRCDAVQRILIEEVH